MYKLLGYGITKLPVPGTGIIYITNIKMQSALHDSGYEPDTEFHCDLPAMDISSEENLPRHATPLLSPASYTKFNSFQPNGFIQPMQCKAPKVATFLLLNKN